MLSTIIRPSLRVTNSVILDHKYLAVESCFQMRWIHLKIIDYKRIVAFSFISAKNDKFSNNKINFIRSYVVVGLYHYSNHYINYLQINIF